MCSPRCEGAGGRCGQGDSRFQQCLYKVGGLGLCHPKLSATHSAVAAALTVPLVPVARYCTTQILPQPSQLVVATLERPLGIEFEEAKATKRTVVSSLMPGALGVCWRILLSSLAAWCCNMYAIVFIAYMLQGTHICLPPYGQSASSSRRPAVRVHSDADQPPCLHALLRRWARRAAGQARAAQHSPAGLVPSGGRCAARLHLHQHHMARRRLPQARDCGVWGGRPGEWAAEGEEVHGLAALWLPASLLPGCLRAPPTLPPSPTLPVQSWPQVIAALQKGLVADGENTGWQHRGGLWHGAWAAPATCACMSLY